MRTYELQIASFLATVFGATLAGCSGSVGARDMGESANTTASDDTRPTSATSEPTSTTGITTGITTSTTDETASAGGTSGPGSTSLAPDDCSVKRSDVQAIFGAHCAGCHSGPNALVYDYVEDLDVLLVKGKIVAGDPEASPIYQKIAADLMPPEDAPKLSSDEKQRVYDWIGQCTGPDPTCADQPFITTDEMIAWMLKAVSNFDEFDVDDQPFIRFFTLTHLYNANVCGPKLDLYRHALAKLLNGLSRNTEVIPLRAVDPEQTIYLIDLRDYGWEGKEDSLPDVWDLLVEHDPFSVQYNSKYALQLQQFTKTAVPFQMADWFVTDASTAPLYDQILYERVFGVTDDIVAMTRFELEGALGIDAQAEVLAQSEGEKEGVVRGGFLMSGVSDQNRIIERHRSPIISDHSYWISHDFLSNLDFGNIFEHPLDFVADGGEIIWTLPNGLQAYLLVDGSGTRVDVANIEIVHNKEHDGEAIVNGTSCMGCHYKGMRAADDEIGPYIAATVGKYSDLQKQQIADLYPVAPALAKVIDVDIGRFVASLEKTGAPTLLNGVEVTQGVHDAFEDQLIDLERAASELGLSPEALAENINVLPDDLKMVKTIPVNRESMRAGFAQAICNLQFGATKACP